MNRFRIDYDSTLEKPESWSLAGSGDKLTALVRCPNCHQIASLSGHTIMSDGQVHPSLVCPYDNCDFHQFVQLQMWTKDT